MKLRLDIIMSVTAVIISLCALFVSITEARLMKIQQKAVLYPHLDFGPSYSQEGFKIYVKNSGAGIALVKSVQVRCRDQYFNKWLDVVDYFLPDTNRVGYNMMSMEPINEKAILPGEELRLLSIPWNRETRVLVDSMSNLEYRIFYCSILDDCWEITSHTGFPNPSNAFKRVEEREFY